MATTSTGQSEVPEAERYILLAMYTVVLVVGVFGIGLMIDTLKSNVRSVTTMAVLNLIIVHMVFLLTVPFRMYFYACGHWSLGRGFCKFISVMIHAHMYIAVIFYVIILVVRCITFYSQRDRLEFYRRLHALAASLVVWVVILLVIFPVTLIEYGPDTGASTNQCFVFGEALKDKATAAINYLLCAVVLLVTSVLMAIQLWILGAIYKKHGRTALSHQEFSAQLKSMCFVMVILICFAPYHAFRVYYVATYFHETDKLILKRLELKNEIFLAVTAFSACDMLIFITRARWKSILSWCWICS
ncbi:hypothetical protein ACEWY4_006756 [Coilia grayii]|uniref:G-protein coupled receptors family 1 profile domain-containing protein n=1 Tax=Coilia grayii TaxID=363190 RepID=A0ABD1KEM2_9TELE